MKKLIINADDFGISESINKGIIDAYKKGTVSDISLMAEGDAYDHAVEVAKENGIRNIGVHIVLSSGESISDRYYKFPWKSVLGMVKSSDLRNRIKNQILTISNSGFNLTHLDSHQHAHMWPSIMKVFVQLAKEFNIKFVRNPGTEKIYDIFDLKDSLRTLCLRGASAFSKNILVGAGIKCNDYFCGHFYAGKLDKTRLLMMLSDMRDGVTELSCHPGYLTDEVSRKYWWHSNCENELKALLDPEIQQAVKANNIELVSYADL
ncbi:MAG: ChbG/HpnK family deacetylase [Candidatus Omnitrophica bacterium]|nr:ChbG/HpnK family deacetylase [Candidatus Omnitrophota bacterium]